MARIAVAPSLSESRPSIRTASSAAVAVVVATLVAYAVLAAGYLRLTPPWQNPDEPAHFNYVAFVASTGGLPVLQPGDWDSALLQRLKTGTLQSSDDITAIRYESWQPPLFYLLAAPVYAVGPPDSALGRLRALDAVFGGLTLLVAFATAREVLTPLLASAVPLAMAGVPMFTAVSASLSADPLANLFAACLVLVLVLRLRRPVSPMLLGVLLGLGLLTKLELAIFVPLAAGVVALRSTRWWRDFMLIVVVTAVVVSPWLVHQVTSYGWTDPFAIARHSTVVSDQPRFPGFSWEWLGQFVTVSFHSFWAQFGWMAIVAPERLYLLWGFVSLLAVLGLVLNRGWLRDRRFLLLLASVGIALVAYVGYNLSFEQFQGRYLFPALVPMAILLARGWSTLPPRPWSALAISAALVALNAYALLRVLAPGFA